MAERRTLTRLERMTSGQARRLTAPQVEDLVRKYVDKKVGPGADTATRDSATANAYGHVNRLQQGPEHPNL